ncbi:MAG: hypothetical protein NXY57DRAFT_1041037 [Lentinula lateritia]|nr:MAG: hypothetical protein NXY57DRAFT_1041037 [Lentinula lateritia]
MFVKFSEAFGESRGQTWHYRLSDTIMLTLQKIRSSLASTTLSDEPLSAADPTDLDNVTETPPAYLERIISNSPVDAKWYNRERYQVFENGLFWRKYQDTLRLCNTNLDAYKLFFTLGIIIYTLVWIRLVWNILALVLQSHYYWLFGVFLGPGAGTVALYLISDQSLDEVCDTTNTFPKLFAWATVLLGIWIGLFIVWEFSAALVIR